MFKCPNCGRTTSGDYCQWCEFPIQREAKEAQKWERKEAVKEAIARVKWEAKKAREAEERSSGPNHAH